MVSHPHNADLLKVSSFRADFLSRKKEGAAHPVTEFVDRSMYSLFTDFVEKFPRKKLCELRDITKEGKYVVAGTITALKLDPTWYYLSCNKCLGGVVEDDGEEFEVHTTFNSKTVGKWKCKKCKLRGIDAVRRYRIQIRVQDSSAAVSMTLFDRDVFCATQKSTEEIYAQLPQVLYAQLPQGEEDDTIPTELHVLVDCVYAFKIDVSDFNTTKNYQIYTVSKMTNSKEILEALSGVSHKKNANNFESSGTSKLTEESVSPSKAIKRRTLENEADAIAGEPTVSKKPFVSIKEEKTRT